MILIDNFKQAVERFVKETEERIPSILVYQKHEVIIMVSNNYHFTYKINAANSDECVIMIMDIPASRDDEDLYGILNSYQSIMTIPMITTEVFLYDSVRRMIMNMII